MAERVFDRRGKKFFTEGLLLESIREEGCPWISRRSTYWTPNAITLGPDAIAMNWRPSIE